MFYCAEDIITNAKKSIDYNKLSFYNVVSYIIENTHWLRKRIKDSFYLGLAEQMLYALLG
jgi:hypothetical protein